MKRYRSFFWLGVLYQLDAGIGAIGIVLYFMNYKPNVPWKEVLFVLAIFGLLLIVNSVCIAYALAAIQKIAEEKEQTNGAAEKAEESIAD